MDDRAAAGDYDPLHMVHYPAGSDILSYQLREECEEKPLLILDNAKRYGQTGNFIHSFMNAAFLADSWS